MPSNLLLRDVMEDDLPIFFEQQLDPDANYMAAFTAKDPTNREAFAQHWNRILADATVIIKTIVFDGKAAGYVLSYEESGKPEVSYWIGKAYWGQGIATQALRHFLAQATQMRPIYARVAKDNVGSLRVLEKCGFTIAGQARGFANARGEEIEEWLLELAAPVGQTQILGQTGMIELSVTYFDQLPALAQDPEIGFAYARLGNWLDRTTGYQAIDALRDKKFLYHHNGNIRASELETQALIDTFQDWQRRTQCPWLSAHLDYHTDEEIDLLLREGTRPPPYDVEQALGFICHAVRTMQAHLPVPLLLENMQHWPLPELDIAATPSFIARVLEETQSSLLLDTAHARITAAILKRSVQSYLEEFPLDRTVEMHVSSPRLEHGQWINCHETLQEEDYALLEWLLERVTPKVITLEYWKDVALAREQILRLNRLIAQFNAA